MIATLFPRLWLLLAGYITPVLVGLAFAVAEPLGVFVSVLPQKTIVEKIGGSHTDVRAMVRPGYSPHTYNPSPRQIAALSKTTLFVRTGVPFEHAWLERIRSANPDMQILDARLGLDVRSIEHREHGGDEDDAEHGTAADRTHGQQTTMGHDPHIWTSPPLVKQIARSISDKLVELDPTHEQDYARNYAAFSAELDTLDQDIRMLLKGLENRNFMVFHPAWGYFADTYGLNQVPIEKEGKEPGARALSALIEQARREDVRVIFVQPQFNTQSAKQIAQAIGGRVVPIDPLSPNYADNLRTVARQIAEAGNE